MSKVAQSILQSPLFETRAIHIKKIDNIGTMSKAPEEYILAKPGDDSTSNSKPRELASPMQAVTRNDDLQNYYYTRHPQNYPIPNTAPPLDRRLSSSRHSRSHSHNSDQKHQNTACSIP